MYIMSTLVRLSDEKCPDNGGSVLDIYNYVIPSDSN